MEAIGNRAFIPGRIIPWMRIYLVVIRPSRSRNKGRKIRKTSEESLVQQKPLRRQDATRFLPGYTYRYALAGYSGISSPGHIDPLSLLLSRERRVREVMDFLFYSFLPLVSLSLALYMRVQIRRPETNDAGEGSTQPDTKHPRSTLPGVGGDVTDNGRSSCD